MRKSPGRGAVRRGAVRRGVVRRDAVRRGALYRLVLSLVVLGAASIAGVSCGGGGGKRLSPAEELAYKRELYSSQRQDFDPDVLERYFRTPARTRDDVEATYALCEELMGERRKAAEAAFRAARAAVGAPLPPEGEGATPSGPESGAGPETFLGPSPQGTVAPPQAVPPQPGGGGSAP